jgi:CRISPR-associated protein Cmr1
MNPLSLEVEVLTPLFLGGAEPNDRAELRAPALKGALRFWYRTVAGDYASTEGARFGSSRSDTGQSPFAIVLSRKGGLQADQNWPQVCGQPPDSRVQGDIQYFGYTLRTRGRPPNDRRCFAPESRFELRLVARRTHIDQEERQAWLASLWLLVAFGGLGNRSRRGFGSLAIVDGWRGWPECEDLALPAGDSPADYAQTVRQGLDVVLQWLGPIGSADRPCFGTGARSVIVRNGQDGAGAWKRALEEAVRLMRGAATGIKLAAPPFTGRSRLDPDYTRVRDHMKRRHAAELGLPPTAGAPLPAPPERAAFGMPLTFRSTSLSWTGPDGKTRNPAPVEILPEDGERFPSPVLLSVARVGMQLHPVYTLLDAPTPANARVKGGASFPAPGRQLLDHFMDHVEAAGVRVLP